jgi:hypothetical protein
MHNQWLLSEKILAKAGRLLILEFIGSVALGAALDYFGFMGELVLVIVFFLNFWTAWYLLRAARIQRRRYPFLYGLLSALGGPGAALPAFLILRHHGRLGTMAMLRARFSDEA